MPRRSAGIFAANPLSRSIVSIATSIAASAVLNSEKPRSNSNGTHWSAVLSALGGSRMGLQSGHAIKTVITIRVKIRNWRALASKFQLYVVDAQRSDVIRICTLLAGSPQIAI